MRKLGLLLATIVLASLPIQKTTEAAPAVEGCRRVPLTPTATPVGTTACPGVRPGGFVTTSAGGCTLGFVYTDRYKQTFITTAGHCIVGERQTRLWAPGKGPIAKVGGKPIGRFVYARLDPLEGGIYDIGLIQVTKGVKVNPQVCHFGGPVGASSSKGRMTLELYGNGDGISLLLPARSLWTAGAPDKYEIFADGPTMTGDSGGPILDAASGRAVGYVVALGAGYDLRNPNNPMAGHVFIKKLGPQMYAASKALRKTFYLKTAKRL
jgi:hypothetical protein